MEIQVSVRNMAYNSAVNIDAISGRETNVSKSENMEAHPNPEANFDQSIYIRMECTCRCIYSRV